MVKIIITENLFEEINKKFNNKEANEIIDLIETLEQSPKKGKEIGTIGGIVIKELKYNKFRFYFITDGYKLKCLKVEELKDLVIKVVKMSGKKDQERVINEIKFVLRNLGHDGFH